MLQQSKNSFKRNIAKMSAGALVLALALAFSAYTNQQQQYSFHNVNPSAPQSTNRLDYQYRPGSSCAASETVHCRVVETLSSAPALGANPSEAAMSSIINGIPLIAP